MPWQRQPQGHSFSGPLQEWMRTWYGWWQPDWSAKMNDPATPTPTDFLAAIAIVGARAARARWERERKQDRVSRVHECYTAMTEANQAARANPQDFGPLAVAAAERVYDLLDCLTMQCSREDLIAWSDSAREQVQRGPIR